ncbi:hypothetical protein BC940DRAFT_304471 [Gongronella butleri]|nr:hypothetical protein BC940DRAFT_304471 [Gongronella butleri]
MDRLTQLQDSIDSMARMFTNSIYYVHEKSNMVQLDPEIPVLNQKVQADPPEVFQANVQELVADLVKQAKEIDTLIEGLPGIERTEDEQIALLQQLEKDNQNENDSYKAAVQELEEARQRVITTLRTIADEQ